MNTTFKEILLENSPPRIAKTNSTDGSGLAMEFSEDQTKQAIGTLGKSKIPAVKSFLKSVTNGDKYSKSLVLLYKGRKFSLYTSNGILRFGGGGEHLSSKKVLDVVDIDEFIEQLPSLTKS